MKQFVGVIDSGVGGLTILNQLQKRYRCNFRYIADHAFCPYGTKTNKEIFLRADKLVFNLVSHGAKAVVVACNTASVFAKKLSAKYSVPVCEVVTPTCERIANYGFVKRVALLATNSTIRNGMYVNTLSNIGIEVFNFPCSSFVPFIEQGATETPACYQALSTALHKLPSLNVQAVILGCTHFPLIKKKISAYCGDAKIIECACDLPKDIALPNNSPQTEYFTTGKVCFADIAAKPFANVCFQYIKL